MAPRPPPTHFLCIPLVSSLSRPQLASALASFSSDVTSPQSFGVPAEAIRPVGTLHLTLGVMSFPKNEGLDRATELLKTLVPRQILGSITGPQQQVQGLESNIQDKDKDKDPPKPLPQQLSVTLRGLHSMQSSLSKAAVLYSPPVDTDGTLQKFCESVKQTFQLAGIMAEEERPLLLHATILNTIYVKGEKGGGTGRRQQGETTRTSHH
ncbi:kinase A anchor protein [Apiospora kogelbergensis]|uniref:kinase A anchor protein n=1 Tax=Apiospora kogelbergensis TaxID=1337665 RepID=UPI00312E1FCB